MSLIDGITNFAFSEDEEKDNIKIFQPTSFEDAIDVSKALLNNEISIINLDKVDDKQRLVDFVCGSAYALSAAVSKINDEIILFCPNKFKVLKIDSVEDEQ